MQNSHRNFVIGCFSILALWCAWLLFCMRISHRVFLKNGSPFWLYILTVGCIFGLIASWQHFLRGRKINENNLALFQTFFGVSTLFCVTFWSVPEVWIYLTATKEVQSDVAFTVEHPGPAIGRYSHCQAGLRYFDDYLARWVELCAKDKEIMNGAKLVRIQRRVTEYGAVIYKYHTYGGYVRNINYREYLAPHKVLFTEP